VRIAADVQERLGDALATTEVLADMKAVMDGLVRDAERAVLAQTDDGMIVAEQRKARGAAWLRDEFFKGMEALRRGRAIGRRK
jgi:hypothetical protein